MYRRKTGMLAVFLIIFSSLHAATTGEMKEAKELQAVKQGAEEATRIFYPRAAARKTTYGLTETESFDTAVLKTPVKLYTFNESTLRNYKAGQPITDLLEPTGQWMVPVSVGGTNRVMITLIENTDGTYTGSTFGMVPLAHKWQTIEAWWPADKFSPRLIILPSAQGYYFTIPEIQPPNLTPTAELTTAAKPALGSAEYLLSSLQKALALPANSDSTNNIKENKTP